MFRSAALVVFAALPLSGCASAPVAPTSGGSEQAILGDRARKTETVQATGEAGWHTVEYDGVAVEVPSTWGVGAVAPCVGDAIVSPPSVRSSCPPVPSLLFASAVAGGPSAASVIVGDLVVSVRGVDAATARRILSSVRLS